MTSLGHDPTLLVCRQILGKMLWLNRPSTTYHFVINSTKLSCESYKITGAQYWSAPTVHQPWILSRSNVSCGITDRNWKVLHITTGNFLYSRISDYTTSHHKRKCFVFPYFRLQSHHRREFFVFPYFRFSSGITLNRRCIFQDWEASQWNSWWFHKPKLRSVSKQLSWALQFHEYLLMRTEALRWQSSIKRWSSCWRN